MPDLKIRKALKFKGQPGTYLFFKQSVLSFDMSCEQKDRDSEREFQNMEACLFTEVQFCFWVDMKDIAYNKKGPSNKYSASKN